MNSNLFKKLENLYIRYNTRQYVHPDPLEFLYDYDVPTDREVVGLIASSLAYGKVSQILKAVSWVLDRMANPADFLKGVSHKDLKVIFSGFRHRFTTDRELVLLLKGIKGVIERYGSLYHAFVAGFRKDYGSLVPAVTHFVEAITLEAGEPPSTLLPLPERGSACKRLHLFLRWMVRKDEVDPGGWEGIPRSELIVPLDTHMHKISLFLGFTKRRQPDLKTALEVTKAFKRLVPYDPARYDFVLTRWGIRDDFPMEHLLRLIR